MFSRSVKKTTESDINQASFVASMIDETTAISEKTQFSIVVTLVEFNSEIQEYFLEFYDINEGRMANDLLFFCKTLEKFNIKHKLVP